MSGALSLTAPSRRVKARRLVEQLHTVLERQIDEGRIKPGERLATERELAVQFSTSRNVVRAALEMLDKAGKITRRVGHGTVVTAPGVIAPGLMRPPRLAPPASGPCRSSTRARSSSWSSASPWSPALPRR